MKWSFCTFFVAMLAFGLNTWAQQKEVIATHNWVNTAYQLQRADSFYYDAAGNLTGMTLFFAVHNGTVVVFVEDAKITYINDAQGRLLEEFTIRLMGSPNDTISKLTYDYFANGKLRVIDENRRDNTTGTWSLSPTRNFYAYTATGQVDSITRYIFAAGNWGLAYISKLYYLPNGQLSEVRTTVYSNGSVGFFLRTEYSYDSTDRLKLIEIFEGVNEPVLRETREYFYGTSSDLPDSLITTNLRPSTPTAEKLEYHYLPNDSLVDTYRYHRHLGQWFPQQWFKTSYRTLSSQVYKPGTLQSKVFPNPVSDYLYIQFDDAGPVACTLRSLSGQLVQQAALQSGENQLDFSSLTPGIYSLELSAGGKIAVHKLVKR